MKAILNLTLFALAATVASAEEKSIGGNTPNLPPEVAAAAVPEHVLYAAPAGRLQVMSINEEQKVIDTVKGSTWRAGCVPTTVGMLLMYWDEVFGFVDLMDQAGNDYSFTNPRNLELIANTQHYNDYFYPEDTAGNIKPDRSIIDGDSYRFSREPTCIADALNASWASYKLNSGATLYPVITPYFEDTSRGLNKWVDFKNPNYSIRSQSVSLAEGVNGNWGTYRSDNTTHRSLAEWNGDLTHFLNEAWNLLVSEVNANRPLVAEVNSSIAKGTDHVVLVVGYRHNKSTGEKFYAAKNTWQVETKWYKFRTSYDGTGEKMGINSLEAVEFINAAPISPESFSPQKLYSFRNKQTGAWFFSNNPNEVHYVWENIPVWEYQGPRFHVETAPSADNAPVYRFYNSNAAAHFYTISPEERDNVIANLSHIYTYEGVAFYGKTWRGVDEDTSRFVNPHLGVNGDGVNYEEPVYRFYLPQTGSHYFTDSYEEMMYLVNYGDPSYIKYEGVAWYAKPLYQRGGGHQSSPW